MAASRCWQPVVRAVASVFRPEFQAGAVIERLKKRREFLMVQKGRRANTGLFSVQRLDKPEGPARLGFTVSKKVDTRAVKRNRIRRRLKEAARMEAGAIATEVADIVVVARREALTASFSRLRSELVRTIARAGGKVQADTQAAGVSPSGKGVGKL